jgi:phospholipid/cholesterol/gamma-HCH transport system substrate-binding protein
VLNRSQKLRVGVFFLILVGAFSAFLLAVAGSVLWKSEDTYFVRYTDTSVAGLQIGGGVVYQGIVLGTVDDIEIDPANVEDIIVTMQLEEGTPIKTDVRARIVPVGITGLSRIELSGGTQDAERLPPGSFVTAGQSTMTDLTESLQSILTNINVVLEDISGVLTPATVRRVDTIIANVEEIVLDNRESVASSLDQFGAAAEGLAGSVRDAERLVGELRRSVEAADVAERAREVSDVVGRTGDLISELDLLLRQNRDEIGETVQSITDTARMLNNFAFQINENPSLLLLSRDTAR